MINNTDNVTDTTIRDFVEENVAPYLSLTIKMVLVIYYAVWIHHQMVRYRDKMEPTHILAIASMVNFLFVPLVSSVMSVNFIFDLSPNIYPILDFFNMYFLLANLSTKCLVEVNRSLALYLNLRYKEMVTNKRTMMAVGVNQLFCFIIYTIYSYFMFDSDEEYRNNACYAFDLQEDFIIVILFETSFYAISIAVYFYVSRVALKFQNQVVPININPTQQDQEHQQTPGNNILNLVKIGAKVNKFSIIQMALLLPTFVIHIVLNFYHSSCDNDIVLTITRIVMIIWLIKNLVIPILIDKRLKLIN